MSHKEQNKLVRDRIPEIIEKSGRVASVRTLSDEEYREALLNKIVEEAGEVLNAKDDTKEVLKELSDVLEVVEHIIKAYKLNPNDVAEVKKKRNQERGGFGKRIFLESTSTT